ARRVELLELAGDDRVLDVGAGSGYQTAILAAIADEVWGVEIIPELAKTASRRLAELGLKNAHVECFDGSNGWPEHAPYDAIVMSARAPRVPVMLLSQLAPGGRFVGPIGARDNQRLTRVTRRGDDFVTDQDIPVRFVDLTGRYGWGGQGAPQA